MGKSFRKISPSIWNSNRLARLSSDTARLTYIYLITSPHVTSIGCYRLPVAYIATDLDHDLSTKMKLTKDIIKEIINVGLIQYDFSEEVMLIEYWFDHNAITNRRHLQGCIAAFENIPGNSPILPALAAEICLSAVNVSDSWRNDPKGRAAADDLVSTLGAFIKKVEATAKTDFISAIKAMPADRSKPLCIALSIDLSTEREGDLDRNIDIDVKVNRDVNREGDSVKSRKSSTSAQSGAVPSPRESASRPPLTGKRKVGASTSAKNSELGRGH